MLQKEQQPASEQHQEEKSIRHQYLSLIHISLISLIISSLIFSMFFLLKKKNLRVFQINPWYMQVGILCPILGSLFKIGFQHHQTTVRFPYLSCRKYIYLLGLSLIHIQMCIRDRHLHVFHFSQIPYTKVVKRYKLFLLELNLAYNDRRKLVIKPGYAHHQYQHRS